MVRSQSRSPQWKRRSLSPVFRAQEPNSQRHYHIDYDCDYKIFQKDSKKLMSWRMKDGKHGQANPRYIPHATNYHRLQECRSYSPTLKRSASEDIDNHKSFRIYSPERNESIRSQFSSRYSEMSRKEHHQSFYPSKIHVREMHEDVRSVGNTKEMKTFHRPLKTSCKFERKWNENDLRYHQLQEDKYVQSPRRFSNEFMPRSSSQKRYPDREYRAYGPSSKKVKEMERYDRETASSSKWKQNHSSSNQEKEEQRNLQDQRHAEFEYSANCETKVTYDYSLKHHRHPDGGKYIADEKEKYMKLDNKKYNYCKGVWKSKYSDHYSSDRASHMGEPYTEVAMKYNSGKGYNSCAKSLDENEKQRIKKDLDFRRRIDFSSSHQHDTDDKISDVHARKEKLTVKVDMKKTIHKYRGASGYITERQTSCDLVAVGKKPECFHPVLEHIKSVTQKVEQNPSKEFAQEIITIIHQVKANYFKSSDLTLHERFSKIQDISGANEVQKHLDPEIHRRIDMSLAELQNKRAISCESGQNIVRILEDPNDLRHDIERRRKERLQNEDENNVYINIPQRHTQSRSFVKLRNAQTYKYYKPSRFPSQPLRKFIKKPCMSRHIENPHDDIANNRFKRHVENPEAVQRPTKYNFIDGHPHFRSNLVQKGLYIQAKYQRLRDAGARGFSTYKIREGLLRKQELKSELQY